MAQVKFESGFHFKWRRRTGLARPRSSLEEWGWGCPAPSYPLCLPRRHSGTDEMQEVFYFPVPNICSVFHKSLLLEYF